ncbi:FadR/GntR family transcriptional regulator [Arthrobacter sp. M4]|uniref:FadR/GntR family transcriptional regulator n=1 Tax=Arthrobacter sp. M4 TaxID=218160 RepID=UPI001CDC66ED|nr:FadR/GntR family transcriptional regulator [Arthrobacter sp. M4]MCA4132532.1 FadR family transcriptional regulator [Arthrobacter sp. M4]
MAMDAPLPVETEDHEPPEAELIRKLMDYLTAEKMRPGMRLPAERQLAEKLGVGRAALRHVLKSLSLLGVLEMKPSAGTFVRNGTTDLLPRVLEWGVFLSPSRAEAVVEARRTLEVELAGLAAERRTGLDIGRLQHLIDQMSRKDNTASEYVDWDVQFHLAIADAARNEVLAGVLRSLQSMLSVWATRVIVSAGETETSLAMHTPILHAIIDGDAESARVAMRAHMDRATRRLYATIAADSIESFSQKTT